MQMNSAYWNVLHEPTVLGGPVNRYEEIRKPAPFYLMTRSPATGIPICRTDVIESRARGQVWSDEWAAKKDDQRQVQQAKALRQTSMRSRELHSRLSQKTAELGRDAQQEWVKIPARRAESARRASVSAKQSVPPISHEDAEAMAHLTRYDNRMYQQYQALRHPTDQVEALLARGIDHLKSYRPRESVV
jgi:hypothetical protein